MGTEGTLEKRVLETAVLFQRLTEYVTEQITDLLGCVEANREKRAEACLKRGRVYKKNYSQKLSLEEMRSRAGSI